MIYLVRHGETRWSREGRKQGRGDSPLTKLGRAQARGCAEALRVQISDPAQVDMYVSPLGRATATAEILRGILNVPDHNVRSDERLAEHDFGKWQGLTDFEIDRDFPGERKKRARDKWRYVIPDGESYAMMKRRLGSWLDSLSEDRAVIVVAHYMVSRVIRGLYANLAPSEVLKLTHPHTSIFRLADALILELKASAISV